jgi:hypothetical protein
MEPLRTMSRRHIIMALSRNPSSFLLSSEMSYKARVQGPLWSVFKVFSRKACMDQLNLNLTRHLRALQVRLACGLGSRTGKVSPAVQ